MAIKPIWRHLLCWSFPGSSTAPNCKKASLTGFAFLQKLNYCSDLALAKDGVILSTRDLLLKKPIFTSAVIAEAVQTSTLVSGSQMEVKSEFCCCYTHLPVTSP